MTNIVQTVRFHICFFPELQKSNISSDVENDFQISKLSKQLNDSATKSLD